MSNNVIHFTPEKYLALTKRYDQAVKSGETAFAFEGQQVLTAYAKYLIEYLSSKFE